jgi:phosphatidylserine decarboxylase
VAQYGVREVLVFGILFGAACVLALAWNPKFALIPFFGFIAVLYFFRDPERRIPEGQEKILSPADGRVRDICTTREDNFLQCDAVRIGITLTILNVHVNRAPCAGEIGFIKYTPGRFHNAFGSKASEENENNLIGITNRLSNEGVAVKQIAGAIARRIVCDCRVEDEVEMGQRIGMIKFGSRTEVFVPKSVEFEILVKPGDKVRAGQTVLGVLRGEALRCAE